MRLFVHFFIKKKKTDIPGSPNINNVTQQGCGVVIEWSTPLSNGCPILFYKIAYKKASPGAQESNEVTVANTGANRKKLSLECKTPYNFQVSAVNKVGSGRPSPVWKATTGKATTPEGMTVLSVIF